MTSYEPRHIRATELYGDFWFNSEPISISALKGYVLLLDFWDYASASCIRSRPYLNEWYRRYKDFTFVVVGIHAPEFKFGRDPENIQRAIKREGIEYPVVMDNDAIIWTAYSSRVWPTRYLVDKEGYVRYCQEGEGSYEQFERAIQSLLAEAGYHGAMPELMEPLREIDQPGAISFRPTGEVRLGYLKGTLGNAEGYGPESTIEYDNEGLHLPGRVYLKGKWYNEKESVRFDGEAQEEGRVSLVYEAVEANSILDAEHRSPCRVFALQDGKPLTKATAGADIAFDGEGKSLLVVDKPRMFQIVRNAEFGQHELGFFTNSPGLALYAFSFGTGVIPELVSNN
jgi:thiol-disulfide isomerase/thioredoxin